MNTTINNTNTSSIRPYRLIESAIPYLIAAYLVFSACMLIWIAVSLSAQQQRTIDYLIIANGKIDKLIKDQDEAKLRVKILDTGKIVILNHVKK